jgi:hypothetical protein
MPADPTSLLERVSSSYSKLLLVANDLNVVSDELGKSVAQIDDGLRKLNLGVTSWVTIYSEDSDDPQNPTFWSEDLGYAKVSGKWGICIRRLDGNYQDSYGETESRWAFNEASRTLRLAAIDKIPELLESLSKEAAETTLKIKAKLHDVQSVASTVNPPTTPKKRTLLQSIGESQAKIVGLKPTGEYGRLEMLATLKPEVKK